MDIGLKGNLKKYGFESRNPSSRAGRPNYYTKSSDNEMGTTFVESVAHINYPKGYWSKLQ